MYKILKFNEIDYNQIKFDKPIDSSLLSPKEYKKGFNIMYINYGHNPLLIELPSVLLKTYNNDNKTLLLTLKSKENKYDDKLNNFFNELDRIIITNVSKILKSVKIKTKDLSYITILQTNDSNEKYIKLKVLNDTKLYNVNKQLVMSDKYTNMILDRTYIGSIIQIVSILFNHEVIYVNIKLHQIRASYHSPKQIILSDYSFNDSDNESQNDDNITDSYINTKQIISNETIQDNLINQNNNKINNYNNEDDDKNKDNDENEDDDDKDDDEDDKDDDEDDDEDENEIEYYNDSD
jgi:hypothetical protein